MFNTLRKEELELKHGAIDGMGLPKEVIDGSTIYTYQPVYSNIKLTGYGFRFITVSLTKNTNERSPQW